MTWYLRRLFYFCRWIYRPCHSNPRPPRGDGRVFRMGPRVVRELAGMFADDDEVRTKAGTGRAAR